MELRAVEIRDVLAARDARVERQADFLRKYACPLVCLTMNIAGPVKLDAAILYAFREGVRRVEAACGENIRAKTLTEEFTGCEAVWAVDLSAVELKSRMTEIEQRDALGRLFDIDVLDTNGVKLARDPSNRRRCLLCGELAYECARSRRHSVAELSARTHAIIEAFFIGETARRALLSEAECAPKPGLVDPEDAGAHTDMDIRTFRASANALRPYFERCAEIGAAMRGQGAEAMFAALQSAGREAEDAMRAATGGVNTHKGAIFSLGLLCGAAGACGSGSRAKTLKQAMDAEGLGNHSKTAGACCAKNRAEMLKQAANENGAEKRAEILSIAADMARVSLRALTEMRPEDAQTGGERQFFATGRTGVRGQAAAGFPDAVGIALPVLERGGDLNEAGLEALLKLMARVEDSNLLRRGGEAGLYYVRNAAKQLLENGWSKDDLRALNEDFKRRNLSPGGSADLLAIAYFLYFLDRSYEGARI